MVLGEGRIADPAARVLSYGGIVSVALAVSGIRLIRAHLLCLVIIQRELYSTLSTPTLPRIIYMSLFSYFLFSPKK
jgi:hypothetical protein